MRKKHRALLFRTCPRTAFASNISPAAVFRYIEAYRPTFTNDEADSFIRGSEELRGILNSGHTRHTAFIIRCEGENHTRARRHMDGGQPRDAAHGTPNTAEGTQRSCAGQLGSRCSPLRTSPEAIGRRWLETQR
jgi:hypothetical protein